MLFSRSPVRSRRARPGSAPHVASEPLESRVLFNHTLGGSNPLLETLFRQWPGRRGCFTVIP